MRSTRRGLRRAWLGVAVALALAAVASGQSEAPAAGAGAAPRVPLDELLKLPSSYEVDTARRGGATRSEWRTRFADAQAAVVDARDHLDKTLARLNELADRGGNWKVAAPGSQAVVDDTSPIDFGLKQEINRAREEVARTERELVDLKVEANLAGVPEDWWRDAVDGASGEIVTDAASGAR